MNYIKVYDDVIDLEYCTHLKNKFHENKDLQLERDTEVFTFDEINLAKNLDVYQNEVNDLMGVFDKCVDMYKEDCQIQDWQFPKEYGFEEIRQKCYAPDKGIFNPHVDAIGPDSMRRFLVFFLYLDEGEGGETILYDQKTYVERKAGRLLMFPPTWTYPHSGAMPKGSEKQIIGSYLHYV